MNRQKNIIRGGPKRIRNRGALILDRDGVLITRPFLTWKKQQMKLSPGVVVGVAAFNALKIPVVVITNQPVVARGLISSRGVEKLHEDLAKRLCRRGARIDGFYFCPHHPEATLKEYRRHCRCRKPAIEMFTRAAREHAFDLSRSVVIGDQTQDILAGRRAGTMTILVKSGFGGSDKKYDAIPHYEMATVAAAMKFARSIMTKKEAFSLKRKPR